MRPFAYPRRRSVLSAVIGGGVGILVCAWVVAGIGGTEPASAGPASAGPASAGPASAGDVSAGAGAPPSNAMAGASETGWKVTTPERVLLTAQLGADPEPPSQKPPKYSGPGDGLAALAEVVQGLGQGYSEPMEPGTWRSLLNGGTLAETCTAYAQKADFTTSKRDCVLGMHAWNGAAFDRQGSIYMRGGGHWSYEGNEIYRFDLATGEWQRMNDSAKAVPKDPNGPERQNYEPLYDDGSPASAHHYAHMTSAKNRLVMGPAFGFGEQGTAILGVFTWTPDGGYEQIADLSNIAYPKVVSVCSQRDPETGDVLLSMNGLRRIDPETGEVTGLGGFVNSKLGSADCLYDPETRQFFAWKGGDLHALDVDTGERARHRGFMPKKISIRSGHAMRDRTAFLWNGGQSVYAWDLTKVPEPSFIELRNADSAESPEGCGLDNCRDVDWDRGNYGKWWYVESLDVFIGLGEAHEPLWVYRPPEDIPETDPRKAELQDQGYTCADTVLGWECPDLQQQVNDGSVQKGVYVNGAKVRGQVNFNGAWIKGAVKNRKASLIAEAGAIIRNVKVTGPSIDLNANCVRLQSSGRVELHNLTCEGADMAVLGNTEELLIANSQIGQTTDSGRQYGHVLYLCGGARKDRCTVTIRDSRIYGSGNKGHTLKTGASRTRLENVTLDETRGKGSRLIDAFNGGVVEIRNSTMLGAQGDGNSDVIGFDYEARVAHTENRIDVENTTIDCAGGNLTAGRNSFSNADILRLRNDTHLENCR
mgnify:FL=1